MGDKVRVVALPARHKTVVMPSYVNDELVTVEYDLERQVYLFMVKPDLFIEKGVPDLNKNVNDFLHAITTNTDRPSRKLRALAQFFEMLEEGELFNAEHDEDTAA